jgi:hypothetical protein
MTTFLREFHSSTQACLDGMVECGAIGIGPHLMSIRGGYVFRQIADSPGKVVVPAIILSGKRGDALFTGFGWGYSGEGSRGLCHMLHFFGVDERDAVDLVIQRLTWSSGPRSSAFLAGSSFIPVFDIERSTLIVTAYENASKGASWKLKPRSTSMSAEVTDDPGRSFGIALDQIIHRQLPGLESRRQVARLVRCTSGYFTRLISGKKPLSIAFGNRLARHLSVIPDMLQCDLRLLQTRCQAGAKAHQAQLQANRKRKKGPSREELLRIIENQKREIEFLSSTDQQNPEPVDGVYRGVAVAMVAEALRADLYALAQTRAGKYVNLVKNNTAVPKKRPEWCVESSRIGTFYRNPKTAADRFVELVGPWAAMNAVRDAMIEES